MWKTSFCCMLEVALSRTPDRPTLPLLSSSDSPLDSPCSCLLNMANHSAMLKLSSSTASCLRSCGFSIVVPPAPVSVLLFVRNCLRIVFCGSSVCLSPRALLSCSIISCCGSGCSLSLSRFCDYCRVLNSTLLSSSSVSWLSLAACSYICCCCFTSCSSISLFCFFSFSSCSCLSLSSSEVGWEMTLLSLLRRSPS